jgi:hypothetical protein
MSDHSDIGIKKQSTLGINFQTEIQIDEETKLEKIRRRFLISQNSPLYLIWKLFGVVLCFTTSFNYGYYATFLHRMDEENL